MRALALNGIWGRLSPFDLTVILLWLVALALLTGVRPAAAEEEHVRPMASHRKSEAVRNSLRLEPRSGSGEASFMGSR